MSLTGNAFLAIWNDIDPPAEGEFNRWHTEEHVPERVGIPGFAAGRRYVARAGTQPRYFTLYETQDLAVFAGPDYLARLNAPSPWTRKMMPSFENFARGACRTVISQGNGVGGALATWRATLPDEAAATEPVAATALAQDLGTIAGVVGVHLGVVDRAVTLVPTNERKLRRTTTTTTTEAPFDAVLLVEATGRAALESAAAAIEHRWATALGGAAAGSAAIYDLAFYLRAADLTPRP